VHVVAGVRLALPTSSSGWPGNAWRQSVWVTGPGWWPQTVGLADPWPVLHAERVFVSALLATVRRWRSRPAEGDLPCGAAATPGVNCSTCGRA